MEKKMSIEEFKELTLKYLIERYGKGIDKKDLMEYVCSEEFENDIKCYYTDFDGFGLDWEADNLAWNISLCID